MLKPWMMIAGSAGLAILVLGFGLNAALRGTRPITQVVAQTKSSDNMRWVAAAPGRVEPRDGEIRISASTLGRVTEVLVGVGMNVEAGELLIKLDDDEARANLHAAENEAGAAQQERDRAGITQGRDEVRRAEDAVYRAERNVTGTRIELDFAQSARRKGTGTEQNVATARRRLDDAQDRLRKEQLALGSAQAKPGLPSPSRPESMVSVARAKVAVADAFLDKTRIRAPIAGTVLQQHAKVGEMVQPSPEMQLVVLGDIGSMRVKAEVDEADFAKIKDRQKVFVRSLSFPGKEFEGTVARIAPTLAPPRLGQRGPRRATDVEVVEVTIILDGKVDLKTGMRVDVFFRRTD